MGLSLFNRLVQDHLYDGNCKVQKNGISQGPNLQAFTYVVFTNVPLAKSSCMADSQSQVEKSPLPDGRTCKIILQRQR